MKSKQNEVAVVSNKSQAVATIKKEIVQSDNRLVMAVQTFRVSEVKADKPVVAVLSAAIEKARLDLGLRTETITTKDNLIFVQSVIDDIRRNCPGLHVGEIPEVIYQFTRGKFSDGKQVFLTVANLCNAFVKWTNSKERHEAKTELALMLEPPPVEPTEEEIEATRLRIIKEAYETYKRTGNYDDSMNYVYESIEKYKQIPFTKDVKTGFMKKAETNLFELCQTATSIKDRMRKKEFLQQLADGKKQEAVVVEAKKLALLEFFRLMSSKQKELSAFTKQLE